MEGELYEEEESLSIPAPPPAPAVSLVAPPPASATTVDIGVAGGASATQAQTPAATTVGGRELKSWERPWSLKELRHEGHNHWSLAADAGLYHYLEDFSSRLLERTKVTQAAIHELLDSCTATTVSTQNVFNEFLLLSNSQFIENRVYEEDETVQAESATEPKTKPVEEQKTATEIEVMLVPKYTEAISYGLNALTLSNVLVSELPVEEEGKIEENVFIDIYNLHALPHVIGTPEFHEDENCGVFYLSDEDEITQEFLSEDEEDEGVYSDDSYISDSDKEEGELMDEEDKLEADREKALQEGTAPAGPKDEDTSSGEITSDVSDVTDTESSGAEEEEEGSDVFDSEGDVATDGEISKAEQKKKEREERRAKRRAEKLEKKREERRKRKEAKAAKEGQGTAKKEEGPRDFMSDLSAAIQRNASGKVPDGLQKKAKKKVGSDVESEEEGAVKEGESDEEGERGSEDEKENKPEAPKKPKEKDLFSSFLNEEEDMEGMFADFEDTAGILGGSKKADSKKESSSKKKGKSSTKATESKKTKAPVGDLFASLNEPEEEQGSIFDEADSKEKKTSKSKGEAKKGGDSIFSIGADDSDAGGLFAESSDSLSFFDDLDKVKAEQKKGPAASEKKKGGAKGNDQQPEEEAPADNLLGGGDNKKKGKEESKKGAPKADTKTDLLPDFLSDGGGLFGSGDSGSGAGFLEDAESSIFGPKETAPTKGDSKKKEDNKKGALKVETKTEASGSEQEEDGSADEENSLTVPTEKRPRSRSGRRRQKEREKKRAAQAEEAAKKAAESKKSAPAGSTTAPTKAPLAPGGSSIFGIPDDGEDAGGIFGGSDNSGIFGAEPTKKTSAPSQRKKAQEEETEEADEPAVAAGPKKPFGGVGLLGLADSAAAAAAAKKKGGAASAAPTAKKEAVPSPAPKVTTEATKAGGLFGLDDEKEEEEAGLFAAVAPKKSAGKKEQEGQAKKGAEDPSAKKVAPSSKAAEPSSAKKEAPKDPFGFLTEDAGEGLFGGIGDESVFGVGGGSSKSKKKDETPAPAPKEQPPAKKGGSLLLPEESEDFSEGKLFDTTIVPTKKAGAADGQKKPPFGGVKLLQDETPVLKKVEDKNAKKTEPQAASKTDGTGERNSQKKDEPKKKGGGLLELDSGSSVFSALTGDTTGGLFGEATPSAGPGKDDKAAKTEKKKDDPFGLGGGGGGLFGETTVENLGLFSLGGGGAKKGAPTKKETATPSVSGGGGGIFGEDNGSAGGDLFGLLGPVKPGPEKKTAAKEQPPKQQEPEPAPPKAEAPSEQDRREEETGKGGKTAAKKTAAKAGAKAAPTAAKAAPAKKATAKTALAKAAPAKAKASPAKGGAKAKASPAKGAPKEPIKALEKEEEGTSAEKVEEPVEPPKKAETPAKEETVKKSAAVGTDKKTTEAMDDIFGDITAPTQPVAAKKATPAAKKAPTAKKAPPAASAADVDIFADIDPKATTATKATPATKAKKGADGGLFDDITSGAVAAPAPAKKDAPAEPPAEIKKEGKSAKEEKLGEEKSAVPPVKAVKFAEPEPKKAPVPENAEPEENKGDIFGDLDKESAPAKKKSVSTRQSLPPISVADLTSKLFEEEKEEAQPKKAAPTVAVPLAERTAKLFSDEPEKSTDKSLPSDLPTKNLEGLKSSLVSAASDKDKGDRKEAPVNSRKAAKKQNKIAALQGTMNLNPLAMLPGAKRPKKEEPGSPELSLGQESSMVDNEEEDVEDLLDSAISGGGSRQGTFDGLDFGEVPGLPTKKPPKPAALTSSGGGGAEAEVDFNPKKKAKKLTHAAKERPQNKGRRLPSRFNRKRGGRGGKAKVIDTEDEQPSKSVLFEESEASPTNRPRAVSALNTSGDKEPQSGVKEAQRARAISEKKAAAPSVDSSALLSNFSSFGSASPLDGGGASSFAFTSSKNSGGGGGSSIFDEAPTAPAKKAAPKGGAGFDDLFAESAAPAPVKQEEVVKVKTKKPKATDTGGFDIFSDPLAKKETVVKKVKAAPAAPMPDIFADPLVSKKV